MKTIASLIITVALATSVFAGSPVTLSSKGGKFVQPAAPEGCNAFGPGFTVGVFGGDLIPRSGKSGLGGGVLGEYFFCENFGIQGSYGAFAAEHTTEHNYTADFVLRLPIKSLCIAPYLLAGGGGTVDGVNLGHYEAGAGLDVRFSQSIGIFADGVYRWTKSNQDNGTVVRLGVKFPL